MTTLYSDNFSDINSLSDWFAPNGGTFVLDQANSQVLFDYHNGGVDPVLLLLDSAVTDTLPVDITIQCRVNVTVDSSYNSDPVSCRAGVAFGYNGAFTGGNGNYGFGLSGDGSHVAFYLNNTVLSSFSADWTANADTWVKVTYSAGLVSAKFWTDGTTEPSTYPYTYSMTITQQIPGIMAGSHLVGNFSQFSISTPDASPTTQSTTRPLFISGVISTDISTSSPLVINGTSPVNSTINTSVPLFVKSWTPITHNLNLFVKQSSFYTNVTKLSTLFVRGTSGVELNSNLSLLINGFVQTLNSQINLFINNSVTINSLPMTIYGDFLLRNVSYRQATLFIWGNASPINASIRLLVNMNTGEVVNNTSLFIQAPFPSFNSFPLIMVGDVFRPWPGRMPLFIWPGGTICESMGLFLQTDPIPQISFSLPMLTGGVGLGSFGSFLNIPLTIIGTSLNKTMNLVVYGKDSGGTSSLLKFVVRGANPMSAGNLPLSIFNNFTGDTEEVPLFIKGDGQNPDYIPFSNSLRLYVQRGPQNGITLFICNPGISGQLPFTIIGAPTNSGTLPLFVGGFGGSLNNNVNLEVAGDVYKSIQSSATLVMPQTYGFVPESAKLYTNGFNY